MIPIELKIRNFLSYGPASQTVSFGPHRLICLSGKNGHGKSALLDAITWCIWGQARKVSGIARAEEYLMHLGQDTMNVSLDFLCNGNRYRVQRNYVQYGNKKSHTELHLGVFDPVTETYASLSEKTARDTQEKIIATIGLDYDACINSIILRQGNANEFSKKTPQERKEILARVIGLETYETLRQRTADAHKLLVKEKEFKEQQLAQQTTELARYAALAADYKDIIDQLNAIITQETACTAEMVTLEQKKQALDAKATQLAVLTAQLENNTQSYKEKESTLVRIAQQWREVHRTLRHINVPSVEEIDALDKKIKSLDETRDALAQLQTTIAALTQRTTTLHHAHASMHQKKVLDATHAAQEAKTALATLGTHVLATEKQRNTQQTQKETVQKTLAQLREQCKDAAAVRQHITVLDKKINRGKEWYQRMGAQGNALHTQLQELKERSLHVHEVADKKTCPLCLQHLSPEHATQLHKKTKKELAHITHQHTRLKQFLPALKEQLIKENKELETLRAAALNHVRIADQISAQETQLKKLEQEMATTEHELTRLKIAHEAAEKEYALRTKQRTAIEIEKDFYKNDPEYAKSAVALAAAQEQMASLHYDHAEHQKLKAQYAELIKLKETHATRVHQQAQQTERIAQAHVMVAELKKLKADLIVQKDACIKCAQETQQHTLTVASLKKQQQIAEQLRKQKDILLHQKGSLEAQNKIRQQLEKTLLEQKKSITKLLQSIDDHVLAVQALGKNGVPALMIENAIPEIEEEANDLLAKLSDNQAHVFLEATRDLKGGGTRETLDIKISDAMGIRPYDLFSGGEAFRIDFALRIAMSKFLARRSGTTLQTLIIDEGFGSQDEDGLQRIMEAIYKIQNEFEKIIIVSHLQSMKNQFPVQFIVHKGPTGSAVTIVEQD